MARIGHPARTRLELVWVDVIKGNHPTDTTGVPNVFTEDYKRTSPEVFTVKRVRSAGRILYPIVRGKHLSL